MTAWVDQGSEHSKALSGYCSRLGMLAKDTRHLSSRVRFACRDVMDMRTNKWVKRGAAAAEKYKTATEFKQEEVAKGKLSPGTRFSSGSGSGSGSSNRQFRGGQPPRPEDANKRRGSGRWS